MDNERNSKRVDDSKKKKKFERSALTNYGVIFGLMGLLGLFASISIGNDKSLLTFIQQGTFLYWIYSFLTSISNIFIVFGIGSIVFDFFGFVTYVRKQLSEVFVTDECLKVISKESKAKLKNALNRHLYSVDTEVDKDSLLCLVEQQIVPLLDEYYHKDYFMTVNCSLETVTSDGIERVYIRKHYTKEVTLCATKPDTEYEIGDILNSQFVSIPGKNDSDLIRLTYLKIGSRELTSEECKNLVIPLPLNDDKYNRVVHVTLKDRFTKEVKVIYKYTILSPLEDCYFINRIRHPTFNYRIIFNYRLSELSVLSEAFTFMESGDNNRKEFHEETHGNTNSMSINYSGWLLPGDGTIFSVIRRHRA